MKIQLPNGEKIKLDDDISLEEKKKIVKQLVDEWRDIVKADRMTWFSNAVKYFLDSLANYLVWHKEGSKNKEDREILSREQLEQMHKFKKRSKSVNFTDLPSAKKESLGIED